MSGTVELLFSGEELLRGDTLNTNQVYLGERLLQSGYRVTHALCVADDLSTMAAAICSSLSRAPSLLVLSGGLGPTEDDLTREAVASALSLSLEQREDLLDAVKARFAERGSVWSDTNRKQALLPRGASALPLAGTAPGFTLHSGSTLLVALPGVPWELQEMWEAHVEPLLASRSGDAQAAHEVRRLRVFGLGESLLAQMLSHLDWHDPLATLGTRANLDGVTLILRGFVTRESQDRLDKLQEEISKALGGKIYSLTNEDLPVVVGRLLRDAGLTAATAESCTGGLLSKRLTDIPGSSDYLLGGVVAYNNRMKSDLLGVPEALLRDRGAVSEEVAAAMAEGVCRATGADCALSTTGIAGPDGGSDEKPVGLVYTGSVVSGTTRVEKLRLFGSRDQIRERAVFSALNMLRRRLGDVGA